MRVGVGCADITPPLPVTLAGFVEGPIATEVHDPLEVRVLRFEEGGTAVCLLVCDLLGMSPHFSGPVRQAVATALGLDLPGVLTACNHTHAGPSAVAGSPWPTPAGYLELLVERCVEAARQATAHVADAAFRFGRWPLPDDLSLNRRGHHDDPTFAVLDVRVAPPGVPPASRLGVLALTVAGAGGVTALVAAVVTAPVGDDLALAALGAGGVALVAAIALGLARAVSTR